MYVFQSGTLLIAVMQYVLSLPSFPPPPYPTSSLAVATPHIDPFLALSLDPPILHTDLPLHVPDNVLPLHRMKFSFPTESARDLIRAR